MHTFRNLQVYTHLQHRAGQTDSPTTNSACAAPPLEPASLHTLFLHIGVTTNIHSTQTRETLVACCSCRLSPSFCSCSSLRCSSICSCSFLSRSFTSSFRSSRCFASSVFSASCSAADFGSISSLYPGVSTSKAIILSLRSSCAQATCQSCSWTWFVQHTWANVNCPSHWYVSKNA